MELHEIIEQSQDCIDDAISAEEDGDLSSVYNCLNRLYDLLITELVPMKRPE